MKLPSTVRQSNGEGSLHVLPPVATPAADHPAPAETPGLLRRDSARFPLIAALGVALFALFLAVLGGAPGGEESPELTIPPPSLAAPAEPVQAGRTIDATTAWLRSGGIPGAVEVADVVLGERTLVAAGATELGAAVWGSTNGDRWEAANIDRASPGAVSRIDAISERSGAWIAVGLVDGQRALWRGQNWRTWEFAGTIEDLSEVDEIIALASGSDRFWLVGVSAGDQAIWISTDGVRWERKDIAFESDNASVVAATSGFGDGHWLHLAGYSCREGECLPAVWKTRDGTTFEAAATDAGFVNAGLTEAPGAIAALSATASHIVAAGTIRDGDQVIPALWSSRDGVVWSNPATFPTPEVSVRLRAVTVDDPAEVSLIVSGRSVAAAVGDTIVTAVGELSVVNAAQSGVMLEFNGEQLELGLGAFRTLGVRHVVEDVAVQGGRIVVVGIESGIDGTDATPIAWVTSDWGSEWTTHRLPGSGVSPVFAGVRDRRMMAVTAAGASWIHDWDVAAAESGAVEVVRSFFAAASGGDASRLIGLLPFTRPVPGGTIEFPGLPDVDWWGETSGVLDTNTVQGTLDFLTELETQVRVADCEGIYRASALDRIRVDCRYRISSDLVATMGLAEMGGRLTAAVAEGEIVNLTTPEYDRVWELLASWARDEEPVAAAPIFGSGESDQVAPQLDAAIAAQSLEWAQLYVSGFLQAGDSIVTVTPAGPIEWTLYEPFEPSAPGALSWLASADGAFWAVTDANTEAAIHGGLWRSTDGIDWTPVGPSPPVEWGSPLVFDDRLVIAGEGGGTPSLMEWTGQHWRRLEMESPPSSGDWWPVSAAVAGNRVLILGVGWDQAAERSLGAGLWALQADNSFELVTVDGLDLSQEASWTLVGTESGFVLFQGVGGFASAPQTQVWRSPDGVRWQLATDSAEMEGYLEWAGMVGDDLAVRAWAGEECEVEAGISVCRPVWELWRSTDGARWERDPSGKLNSYSTTVSGPRGVLTMTQPGWWWGPDAETADPISLTMAADGGDFVDVGHFQLGSPLIQDFWIGDAAMSASHIVLPVFGFSIIDEFEEGPGFEQGWLLVGEFLEP